MMLGFKGLLGAIFVVHPSARDSTYEIGNSFLKDPDVHLGKRKKWHKDES